MIRAALLLALVLCPLARAQDEEVPLGLIMPRNAELAKPGIKVGGPPRKAMKPSIDKSVRSYESTALSRAQEDLIADLRGRQKAGLAPKPDIDLVVVNLRLLMRSNIDALKFGSSWKRYPKDKDFLRQARMARISVATYVSKIGKRDVGRARHRKAVLGLIDKALKRLAKSMRTNLSRNREAPQAPPPAPDEERYLAPTESGAEQTQ